MSISLNAPRLFFVVFLFLLFSMRVLESAEYVASQSRSVRVGSVNDIAVAADLISKGMKEKSYTPKTWMNCKLHPQEANSDAIDFIFLMDLLNFSFFSDTDIPFTVSFQGQSYTGYLSLCALIQRALAEGIPFTKPEYMKNASIDELRHIFRSDTSTPISFIQERCLVCLAVYTGY